MYTTIEMPPAITSHAYRTQQASKIKSTILDTYDMDKILDFAAF